MRKQIDICEDPRLISSMLVFLRPPGLAKCKGGYFGGLVKPRRNIVGLHLFIGVRAVDWA